MRLDFFQLNDHLREEGQESRLWHNLCDLYNTQQAVVCRDNYTSVYRVDWYYAGFLEWQNSSMSSVESDHPMWEAARKNDALRRRAEDFHWKYTRRMDDMRERLYRRLAANTREYRFGMHNMMTLRPVAKRRGVEVAKVIATAKKTGRDPWVMALAMREGLRPGTGYLHREYTWMWSALNKINQAACEAWSLNLRRFDYDQWQRPPHHWIKAIEKHHEENPTANPERALHLVHVSEDDPTMLAYTQSVDKLLRSIQTKTKPGRYLAKFYPEMSERDRAILAETWDVSNNKQYVLKFIESDDPDGWVRVYENGPQSCMCGSSAVQVYAYPGNGLRLAYWESALTGEIVARAIVREDDGRKEYVRVYPNPDNSELTRMHNNFKQLLVEQGYKHGNLDGIKLRRIMRGHDYVMPYLDYGNGGAQSANDEGDCIIVDDDGHLDCTNTSGYADDRGARVCDECGERFSDDELTYVESEENHVCECCLSENFTYAYGHRYQTWFRSDEVVYCESDGNYYVEQYADNHDVYRCAVTDKWYDLEELTECDIGRYACEYIHIDEVSTDEITEERGHCREFEADEAGVLTHEDYLKVDHLTGGAYHEQTMVQINLNEPEYRVLFIHPENLTAEALLENFVKSGHRLALKGECDNMLTRKDVAEGWEPINVGYPDHGDYTEISELLVAYFDEISEGEGDDEDEDDAALRQLEILDNRQYNRPYQIVDNTASVTTTVAA